MKSLSQFEKWMYYPVTIAWTIAGFDRIVQTQFGKPLWPAYIFLPIALLLWAYPMIAHKLPLPAKVLRILVWISAIVMLAYVFFGALYFWFATRVHNVMPN